MGPIYRHLAALVVRSPGASTDRKLVRVIIFAIHPERFFYECGLEAARIHDLKLNAAAEMTFAKVEKDFFQSCVKECGRSWDSTEDKELSKNQLTAETKLRFDLSSEFSIVVVLFADDFFESLLVPFLPISLTSYGKVCGIRPF
ncbi:MAG: hypothetical protein FRX48_07026 [Lasallia pustulata]|uniref:Uncharacterized protein n=1 Tax=Lasallia pustulata TaxID=136370 RepID=A0A5M8PKQ7_9LECA|nr:MAG: hypothetical protein FRX48_07026 [Lasallia pustulata]